MPVPKGSTEWKKLNREYKILQAKKSARGSLMPKEDTRLKWLEERLGEAPEVERKQIREERDRGPKKLTSDDHFATEVSEELLGKADDFEAQKVWEKDIQRGPRRQFEAQDSRRGRSTFKQKGMSSFAVKVTDDLKEEGFQEEQAEEEHAAKRIEYGRVSYAQDESERLTRRKGKRRKQESAANPFAIDLADGMANALAAFDDHSSLVPDSAAKSFEAGGCDDDVDLPDPRSRAQGVSREVQSLLDSEYEEEEDDALSLGHVTTHEVAEGTEESGLSADLLHAAIGDAEKRGMVDEEVQTWTVDKKGRELETRREEASLDSSFTGTPDMPSSLGISDHEELDLMPEMPTRPERPAPARPAVLVPDPPPERPSDLGMLIPDPPPEPEIEASTEVLVPDPPIQSPDDLGVLIPDPPPEPEIEASTEVGLPPPPIQGPDDLGVLIPDPPPEMESEASTEVGFPAPPIQAPDDLGVLIPDPPSAFDEQPTGVDLEAPDFTVPAEQAPDLSDLPDMSDDIPDMSDGMEPEAPEEDLELELEVDLEDEEPVMESPDLSDMLAQVDEADAFHMDDGQIAGGIEAPDLSESPSPPRRPVPSPFAAPPAKAPAAPADAMDSFWGLSDDAPAAAEPTMAESELELDVSDFDSAPAPSQASAQPLPALNLSAASTPRAASPSVDDLKPGRSSLSEGVSLVPDIDGSPSLLDSLFGEGEVSESVARPLDLEAPRPVKRSSPRAGNDLSGSRKATVHFKDGVNRRGTIEMIDTDADLIRLEPARGGGEPEDMVALSLKAIFLMLPSGVGYPEKEGLACQLRMIDGRQLRGFTPDYDPQRKAFTLFPSEDRGNIERVIVFNDAVKNIWFDED
ncbi:MAG: hypothetical protein JXR96_14060 [Deltaproteobacteria bacterium]|nr:hypothetical protein [Deltaproteobacteria bacterium]